MNKERNLIASELVKIADSLIARDAEDDEATGSAHYFETGFNQTREAITTLSNAVNAYKLYISENKNVKNKEVERNVSQCQDAIKHIELGIGQINSSSTLRG